MHRLTLTPPAAILLLACLPLLGCPTTDKDSATTGDADTDTDADTDADADADTDTDTDADVNYTSLTGTAVFQDSVNGFTNCDVTSDIVGTPFTGDCFGCVFAFDTTGTTTSNNGGATCEAGPPTFTFVPDGGYQDLTLMFWDDYYGYENFAVTQYYYYYEGYGVIGPYLAYLGYDGNPYGTATFDGSAFTVSQDWEYGYQYYKTPTTDFCGPYPTGTGAGTHGGASGESDASCTAWTTHDVWTFEVTTAGPVTITVDTVSDGTAFDPYMTVNGPDGCTIGSSDDAFTCTFPPPNWACPAMDFEAEIGTYTVDIVSYGDCAGSTAEYALYVGGASGEVTQVTDNENFSSSNLGDRTYARNYQLNATLTK